MWEPTRPPKGGVSASIVCETPMWLRVALARQDLARALEPIFVRACDRAAAIHLQIISSSSRRRHRKSSPWPASARPS
jgi:hypothetical protein